MAQPDHAIDFRTAMNLLGMKLAGLSGAGNATFVADRFAVHGWRDEAFSDIAQMRQYLDDAEKALRGHAAAKAEAA